MNYHNRIFKVFNNSDNGDTSSETTFHYKQEGNILTSIYSGGSIVSGHLIGLVDSSTPEILPDGRIRLHEEWRWTNGDLSVGKSTIEEIV
ncbi:n-acetylglutamate synthase [Sphingobacterium sp.]|uniref:n-acetylglutamate synthase n=1 Tax=Sphingobacterium sp. TaxID=341027 RepID=UPI00258DD731|nr:n-acetylglutamate synthase [Sphingobacterium sp.]WET68819.1 MAG: n-acetylglutamate synthase [Sphingobacterium sp.]